MEKNRRSIVGFGENLKASIITQDQNPTNNGNIQDMGGDDSDNDSIKSRQHHRPSMVTSKQKTLMN
jgi:hypothetical protein